jgi:hypothetical protein
MSIPVVLKNMTGILLPGRRVAGKRRKLVILWVGRINAK